MSFCNNLDISVFNEKPVFNENNAPAKNSVFGELVTKVWGAVVTFFTETISDFVLIDIPEFFNGLFPEVEPMSEEEANKLKEALKETWLL